MCCFVEMNNGSNFFSTETMIAGHFRTSQQFIFLLDVDACNCLLQENGATAHTANDTMPVLCEFFDERASFLMDHGLLDNLTFLLQMFISGVI